MTDGFIVELARAVRWKLPDETAGLSFSDLHERVRTGVGRAAERGVVSAEAICRFVLLMFALEPEFDQRQRVREHVAAAPSLDEALLTLETRGHPNCWYRAERSTVEERWSALLASPPDSPTARPLPVQLEANLPPQLSPSYGFQLDAPYVATPEAVVQQILELAEVGPDDTVLDLGCGDGRIAIAAASRFGARGIGVDIDPERILAAREAAERAGVADRVSFHRGDLFDAPVAEATVVTLYLLPHVNLELRDRLRQELKPGARIVSRHFDMGDWKPDRQTGSAPHTLYCWRV